MILDSIYQAISKLEHYRTLESEGLSAILPRSKCLELHSVAGGLESRWEELRRVFQRLLNGLIPDSELRPMLTKPMVDLWRRESIQQKIRARLWDSTPDFQNIINDIMSAIDKINQEIDSQRYISLLGLRCGMFSLKRLPFEKPLSTIQNGISELKTLVESNIKLATVRKVQLQIKLFLATRIIASSLHHVLQTSFPDDCTYKVALRLQNREANMAPPDDHETIIGDILFRLAVSYQPIAYGHKDDLEIKTVLTWKNIVVQLIGTSPPSPLGSSQTTSTGTITTSLTESVASSADLSQIGVSQAPFKTFHPHQQQAALNGDRTLFDEFVKSPRRFSIHPAPYAENLHVVSLADILEQQSLSAPPLYRRERLAATISSSVLQLYGTPWLPRILGSQDIFFLLKPNHPRTLSITYGDDPVLIQKLHNCEAQPTEVPSGILPDHDLTLVSLGCLLTEVLLWRPLHSGRTPAASLASRGVDLVADYKVAKALTGEVPFKYRMAVERCLDGYLHGRGYGFENVGFCEVMFARVVAILADEARVEEPKVNSSLGGK
jgi:hypothetical protein